MPTRDQKTAYFAQLRELIESYRAFFGDVGAHNVCVC